MRYLFGLLCICALGTVPLGCGDEEQRCEPSCSPSARNPSVQICTIRYSADECDDGNHCTLDYCTGGGVCKRRPINCQTTFPPKSLDSLYDWSCVTAEFDVCDPAAPEDEVCGAIRHVSGSCSGDGYLSICLGGSYRCGGGECLCLPNMAF
jgi:hypothetical protein